LSESGESAPNGFVGEEPKHRLNLYATQRITKQVALDNYKVIEFSPLNSMGVYSMNPVILHALITSDRQNTTPML